MILETAALCLALNIYHEARDQMIPGQYAVASVTMNRAGRDDRRICEVVTAPKQFSWTNNLLTKRGDKYVLKREGIPKDERAWALAQHIAKYALKTRVDFVNGATHYHATYVSPPWRLALLRTKRMGEHIFYKQA